ncbi:type II toxin-antitoxin system Phd/YefM family antitoxin [Actinacidiphila yeochonensis]|uniref:type II toxin-antitoxin system prevent-host-death family antitoxin n=1 Tax=Actinacidiphila yeochonensis TaxID=89050 RepID=UPI000A62A38B|nr:type II toxin-antitoxin system prevent-host-death family antitoxin [Actinacidiphila yeochonensis]
MAYPGSRARHAEVPDSVVADREEVVVPRAGHEPVVVVSPAVYASSRETAYRLRGPAGVRRLLGANSP